MLIKAVRTGRKSFGDKQPPNDTTVTIMGVKIEVHEADTWSSGEHPNDGEYIRCTFLKRPNVDPWPNIKPWQPKGPDHD